MYRKTLIVGSLVCLLSGWAFGKEPQGQRKSVWELGIEISSIAYEEPDLMKETGTMYGITGSYTSPNDIKLRIDGRYSSGKVDYDGATWGGTPLTISNISDYMWEFRGVGVKEVSRSRDLDMTILCIYAGIGYRYLNDDLARHQAGYERESTYYYIPLGMEVTNNLVVGNARTDWSLKIIFEYDIFLRGEQISHLSDINPELNNGVIIPDVTTKQNEGYGYRASITFCKKSDGVSFVIEPFFRYWNIDKSDVVGVDGWCEPKNNSTEVGINFSLRF